MWVSQNHAPVGFGGRILASVAASGQERKMLAVRPYWENVRRRDCSAGNAGLVVLVGNAVWREKLSLPGRREAPPPVNPPHFFVTGPAVCGTSDLRGIETDIGPAVGGVALGHSGTSSLRGIEN
jgi:hypothetical protein